MRKVEALLKVLLNLADHIMYLIPVIDLCLSSLCSTAFLLLLYQLTASSTLMFLTMERYQADFLKSVDTRCRRIGARLLICMRSTLSIHVPGRAALASNIGLVVATASGSMETTAMEAILEVNGADHGC